MWKPVCTIVLFVLEELVSRRAAKKQKAENK